MPVDERERRLDALSAVQARVHRYNEAAREVLVHLYVSQPLTEEECRQPTLDLQAKREIDTNFVVGLFDFPMIDNTRLSGGERTAVSLTALNPSVLSVALTYFPRRAPA